MLIHPAQEHDGLDWEAKTAEFAHEATTLLYEMDYPSTTLTICWAQRKQSFIGDDAENAPAPPHLSEAEDWGQLFSLGAVMTLLVLAVELMWPTRNEFENTESGFLSSVRTKVFSNVGKNVIEFFLATPVQVVIGGRFVRRSGFAPCMPVHCCSEALILFAVLLRNSAWYAFPTGNMGTLVALSSCTAYLFSLAMLLRMVLGGGMMEESSMPMFDMPVMLLTFISFGKVLESLAKERTTAAIDALKALQPQVATRVVPAGKSTITISPSFSPALLSARTREQGLHTLESGEKSPLVVISDHAKYGAADAYASQGAEAISGNGSAVESEEEVMIEDLCIGDLVRVRPGQSIPVDAVVMRGEGEVDEAMVTGESMPVHKRPGSSVLGATLNKSGVLTCRVTTLPADSMLAQIIQVLSCGWLSLLILFK